MHTSYCNKYRILVITILVCGVGVCGGCSHLETHHPHFDEEVEAWRQNENIIWLQFLADNRIEIDKVRIYLDGFLFVPLYNGKRFKDQVSLRYAYAVFFRRKSINCEVHLDSEKIGSVTIEPEAKNRYWWIELYIPEGHETLQIYSSNEPRGGYRM
jgi:hypothetical protein